MIGTYGQYGTEISASTIAALSPVKKADADVELLIAKDYAFATAKPSDPDYYQKREDAIRRYYERQERRRLAQEEAALAALNGNGNGGGLPGWVLPAGILTALALVLFLWLRRRRPAL